MIWITIYLYLLGFFTLSSINKLLIKTVLIRRNHTGVANKLKRMYMFILFSQNMSKK